MKVFSRVTYSLAFGCNLSLLLIADKMFHMSFMSSSPDQEAEWQLTDLKHLEPLNKFFRGGGAGSHSKALCPVQT